MPAAASDATGGPQQAGLAAGGIGKDVGSGRAGRRLQRNNEFALAHGRSSPAQMPRPQEQPSGAHTHRYARSRLLSNFFSSRRLQPLISSCSCIAELTYLKLVKLDISGNRISVLPNELRKMKSLVELKLSDNPLTSPPAAVNILFQQLFDPNERIVNFLLSPCSCVFAGERTSSSTWRGRRPSTSEPGAAEPDGDLWRREATPPWTRGPIAGTTSTAATAPATASTNAGPKRSTARLVYSSFFSLFCSPIEPGPGFPASSKLFTPPMTLDDLERRRGTCKLYVYATCRIKLDIVLT